MVSAWARGQRDHRLAVSWLLPLLLAHDSHVLLLPSYPGDVNRGQCLPLVRQVPLRSVVHWLSDGGEPGGDLMTARLLDWAWDVNDYLMLAALWWGGIWRINS